MRVPIRRAQLLKKRDDEEIVYVTGEGLERLKNDLQKMKQQQPAAIEDVAHTGSFGDLRENAEYQEAKFRLRRINGRIESLQEKIKRAQVISLTQSGRVYIGSTVTLEVNKKEKVYQIVGPQEANPAKGRISHRSPLGAALINHAPGDLVTIQTENGKMEYKIISV